MMKILTLVVFCFMNSNLYSQTLHRNLLEPIYSIFPDLNISENVEQGPVNNLFIGLRKSKINSASRVTLTYDAGFGFSQRLLNKGNLKSFEDSYYGLIRPLITYSFLPNKANKWLNLYVGPSLSLNGSKQYSNIFEEYQPRLFQTHLHLGFSLSKHVFTTKQTETSQVNNLAFGVDLPVFINSDKYKASTVDQSSFRWHITYNHQLNKFLKKQKGYLHAISPIDKQGGFIEDVLPPISMKYPRRTIFTGNMVLNFPNRLPVNNMVLQVDTTSLVSQLSVEMGYHLHYNFFTNKRIVKTRKLTDSISSDVITVTNVPARDFGVFGGLVYKANNYATNLETYRRIYNRGLWMNIGTEYSWQKYQSSEEQPWHYFFTGASIELLNYRYNVSTSTSGRFRRDRSIVPLAFFVGYSYQRLASIRYELGQLSKEVSSPRFTHGLTLGFGF